MRGAGRLISCAAMLLIAAGACAAEQPYPQEVQAVLDAARRECLEQGGTDIKVAPEAVRKLDLTGDRRDDYIVDMHEVACVGREHALCGTGGCNLTILVALKDGKLRRVFDGRVRSHEISKGRGARTISFDLHGGYCGRSGAYPCPKKRRIGEKPFRFVEPR